MQLSKKEVQTSSTKVANNVGKTFDISTNKHKKRTMIAILSLSLCFLLATTFGLQAVFRDKVDPVFVELENSQIIKALNQTISKSIKDEMQANFEKQSLQKSELSLREQEIYEYYQSDKFFNQLDSILEKGDYGVALEFMFENINEYLEENFAEDKNSTVSKPSDMLRNFFVGIQKSVDECQRAWEKFVDIIGWIIDITEIWEIISDTMPQIVEYIAIYAGPIVATLKIICAAIPIIGWIALGLLVAVELTIYITMLVSGYHNRGFKVGVDVKTGWLGIPTGLNWVCG